jgi:outer membrane protein assembly factor BamB
MIAHTQELAMAGTSYLRRSAMIARMTVARAIAACLPLLAILLVATPRAEDVLTQRSNNLRTGASVSPGLNQASVRDFHWLAALSVDAPVLAQPLFTAGLNISDRVRPLCARGGVHDVVWVATVTNRIYAFDAETFEKIFCDPIDLGEPYTPSADDWACCLKGESIMVYIDGKPIIGIESTPVIDRELHTMFVGYRINAREAGEQRIAAIDINTGEVVRTRAVPGSGLWHRLHRNRASLLLDRGTVYLGFSAVNEEPRAGPYARSFQGWIHAFDARTLIYRGAWRSMHDKGNRGGDPADDAVDGGGIWQASTGLAADGQGNLFFATGNAMKPWNPSGFIGVPPGKIPPPLPDANNLSNSVVRLKATRAPVKAPPAGGDPVTMVTSLPNQQHVFYRGLDGSIQHIFWDANEPPDDLQHDVWTRPDSPHASGNPATMVTTAPNQQHVFYRAIDGSIQHIFWDAREPPGRLHRDNWTALGHAPLAGGNPVTMATSNPNQQHVFYRGIDGVIEHLFWDARERPGNVRHDTWSVRNRPRASGDPATMVTATPNQQHVFYRGIDGSIQHIFWDASEPPGVSHLHRDSWTSLAQAPLAAGDPVTMVTASPNQQHVFYRARDNSIQHLFREASEPPPVVHPDTWTLPSPPRAVGSPATMATATPNQQHIFHRASDGSIRHIFWDASGPAGTPYLHRDSWTGLASAPPAAGAPATMVTSMPDQQHVFYRANDRSIQHIFWDTRDAPGALRADDWSHLPDQVVMIPADWFTPYRKIWQDIDDFDLGGGGVVLLPGNLLAASGKEGVLYLLDRNNLGKFDADPPIPRCPIGYADDGTRDRVVDKVTIGTNRYVPSGFLQPCGPGNSGQWIVWPHVHGTPVFGSFPGAGDFLYVWPEKDTLKRVQMTGTGFDRAIRDAVSKLGAEVFAPPWKDGVAAQVGMPGGMLTLSIDPTEPRAGVLFASVQTCGNDTFWRPCSPTLCKDALYHGACVRQNRGGVLYAFDPITLKELWNNQQLTGTDDPAPWRDDYDFAKFVPPTVANGKVFLATMSKMVIVYGNH